MTERTKSRFEPDIEVVLFAFAGMLILGTATESWMIDLSYPDVLLLMGCMALLVGTIAGLSSSCSRGFVGLFLLWLPGCVLIEVFSGFGGAAPIWHVGFDTWQFAYGVPLLLAAIGGLAASIAARSRRENKYWQLSKIVLIGLILWGSLELMSYCHIGGPPGWRP